MTSLGLTGHAPGPGIEPAGELTYPSDRVSVLRGRYALERLLEEDRLACVYLARDQMLDRLVAVTVLQHDVASTPRVTEHFLDAERQLAALFHPNLVTILDAGTTDGLCWSAHEYCGGGRLRQRLPVRQPIPGWQVVSLLSQIGSALDILHLRGLLHGGLTPSSVWFDDAGSAKLGALGLAAVGRLLGSGGASVDWDGDAYLAPEQRDGAHVGPAADQYALALIGTELLAGCWHPEGVGVGEHYTAELLAFIRQSRSDIPASLVTALSRALSSDLQRRFASVRDFLVAISGNTAQSIRTADSSAQAMPLSSTKPGVEPDGGGDAPTQRYRKPSIKAGRDRATVTIGRARSQAEAAGRQAVTLGRAALADLRTASYGAAARVGTYPRRHAGTAMDWYGRQHAADRLLLALGVVALILAIGLIGPTVLHPPPSVAVPSFEGKSADAARSLASESGLQVALNDESSAGVPAGVVIRQQPSAGDSLRSDRPVHLAVSSGPPPVAMPNILRHDLDSARQELVAAGLALGNVYEYDTNHQAWGTITAQSIRSGRDVPPGSAVDVTIATPPWTTVPRVVDRGIADAEKELTNRGLKLERVNVESQDGVAAGTVLRQEPAPEAQIRQGSGVAVVIAVPGAAEAATR